MSTLVLSASDVRHLLDREALLGSLRDAFAGYSTSRAIAAQRAWSHLNGAPGQTVMMVFPGVIDGIPAYTVKVNTKIPGGSPSVVGAILLIDLATGHPLAIMDSIVITAERTALAAAVASDALARRDVSRVAVIGAGVQGEAQVRALRLVRRVKRVDVVDAVPERAEAYAARVGQALGIEVAPHPCTSAGIRQAVGEADVIITATWARDAFLTSDLVRDGTHITAVGADEPAKAELDAALIRRAVFVCDDRDLAVSMGAIAGAGLGPDAIHAELGEVIAGTKPGRTARSQITIFGSVGLAFQDLAAAWPVYERARAIGAGKVVELG